MVLAVELLQSLGEAVGDAVLLIEGESLLNSLVREDVAVGEVLCEDAAPGLVLLCEIFGRVTLGVTSGLARSDLLEVGRGGDIDLVGAELCVVEEESGLSGSLFLEAHSVRLGGFVFGVRGDGKVGDLATDWRISMCDFRRCVSDDLPEAEEVPDLLLSGLVADALDVDGVGHVCGVFGGVNWFCVMGSKVSN